MVRLPGAPAGGRVHWLLWALRGEFVHVYEVHYDYLYHNYAFIRYRPHRYNCILDIFIVIRTSNKCWRVFYFNDERMIFKFESCKTFRECASWILNVYSKVKNL